MPEVRVEVGRDGTRRVEHGDREVGQDQRECRQWRDAVHAGLAVTLPAGQAAGGEPDGECHPAGGLQLRQVPQVRHHQLDQLGQHRVGALPRPGGYGRLDVAAEPQRLVRQQHLAEPRPVRRGAAQHLGGERMNMSLDQLTGGPVFGSRQPGDEVLAVPGDRGLVPFTDRVDQSCPGREVIGNR
jgi:hypothetical protein